MPNDVKRINGPDSSHSYKIYAEEYLKSLESELATRVGRKNDESRKICKFPGAFSTLCDLQFLFHHTLLVLESGVLSNARGSAYIEVGNTKLAVGVFDPREIPKSNKFKEQGDLHCDVKFSPFSCTKRRSPMPDQEEKSLAVALKRALSPAICRYTFPNFQVDIFVNVLENDGSVLAAAITATGLAIADAGIPMYDVVTGATVAVHGEEGFLVDPTAAEEEYCALVGGTHGVLTIARMAVLEQVSEMYFSGFVSPKAVTRACEAAIRANAQIAPLVKQILVKKVTKDVKVLKQREKEITEVVVVNEA